MTLGACAMAAIAFPAISAKAAAQKDAARWEARAQAFSKQSAPAGYESPLATSLIPVFKVNENLFARDMRLLN